MIMMEITVGNFITEGWTQHEYHKEKKMIIKAMQSQSKFTVKREI